jgi:hypothetical protein
MEYENGVIRLENSEGRQWQLSQVEKPRLSFAFDGLSVTREHALRRVGGAVQPLNKRELEEVASFISRQTPPSKQKQIATDLKIFAYGLVNSAVTQLGYDNPLHVMMTGREGSADLRASEARHVLDYIDTVWNAFHALTAQVEATPDDELKAFNDYANMMPMIPKADHFRKPRAHVNGKATNGATHAETAAAGGPVNGAGSHFNLVNVEAASAANAMPVPAEMAGRPVRLEMAAAGVADFSSILDRAFVFDDVVGTAQLRLFEEWALQTPHWMLTNSSHSKDGTAKHRIWGASFIEPWRRNGWAGLPPVLFSMIATLLQKLDVTIIEPEYIGLNGQSKDQVASMHTDCEHDSPDDLSILFYLGERTDGDLLLYDKDDHDRLLHRIAYVPNRVVAFDGSVPHQALAPSDDKFRMSLIIRGKYKPGFSDLIPARRSA